MAAIHRRKWIAPFTIDEVTGDIFGWDRFVIFHCPS
jgi:hypothetical protein